MFRSVRAAGFAAAALFVAAFAGGDQLKAWQSGPVAPSAHYLAHASAAVDLGGVCITPLQRDFERLSKVHIVQMFDEVMLSPEKFQQLIDRIRSDHIERR